MDLTVDTVRPLKTYVINLARAEERRAFMEAQLTPSQLDWEFVEAVEGRELTPSETAELVDSAAVQRWPNWLTPGAIGCVLSHRRVYERVAAADSGPALVLEDDALLPANIAQVATRITQLMRDDDLVLLEFRSFKPCRLSRTNAASVEHYQLLTPLDTAQVISAVAYLVGPQAAAAMAGVIVPVRWAADSWAEYVRAGAVGSIRCVLPRPVGSTPTMGSTIGHGKELTLRERAALSAPLSPLRELNRRRIAWRMHRVTVVD